MTALSPAIVGVGHTRQGRVPGVSPRAFAFEAAKNAIADAGVSPRDVDGILVQGNGNVYPADVARALRIQPRFSSFLMPYGTSATLLAQQAAMAVSAGVAETVLCCYGNSGRSLVGGGVQTGQGTGGDFTRPYGIDTAAMNYAFVAARHMAQYGTTREQLGAVALAARQWAQRNPAAQMHDRPFDLDVYMNGRYVSTPLTVFDCCLVSDGGRAFIVTTGQRAQELARPPVYIRGFAEEHLAGSILGKDSPLASPAVEAMPRALRQAGMTLADIDVFQIYDCFTPAIIITLEDYGLCAKGEGGPFVEDGKLAPGGSLAMNTSGGLLSEVYLHNWTQVTEAVLQVRHEAGQRQVADCHTAAVGANGGTFQHHAVLILSADE